MPQPQSHLYLIDLVLMAFALEAICLIGYYAATRKGLRPGDVIANLTSGLMLVLALRLALSGASSALIGACLLGSFAAHIADLWRRW